jgi:UDP-N-acetylglucosamine 2-epimerase (non-hydrolysing)
MKKRISLIFGTRPEAIKMAPIIKELSSEKEIECHICVSGQHKEMLEQVLQVFNIKPHINLQVMKEGQSLSQLTATLLQKIDSYIEEVKPDLVLAEGDTTTVLATALVCFYHKVPFGHVEAGLRTYDLSAPWPEEANRVLTSRITTLHFAPTQVNHDTLLKEGVSPESIFLTGNTIVDALKLVVSQLGEYKEEVSNVLPREIINSSNPVVLITGHRRENFDGGLERVCQAIRRLAESFPNVLFVYPVHLNPKVQEAVKRELASVKNNNVILLSPLGYIPFVWLMNRSKVIITDSGGIQEEAPTLGKPLLVTREVTERPEGVVSGNALLVGTDVKKIVEECTRLLTDDVFYKEMSSARNPYGDGTAARKIIDSCKKYLKI